MEGGISIKGTREGLVIALGQGEMDPLCDELGRHLKQQSAFFRGGVVTIDAGTRALTPEDLVRLKELLAEHSMVLRSVSATDSQTVQSAASLGFHIAGGQHPEEPLARQEASRPGQPPVTPQVAEPAASEDSAEAIARAGARGLVMRRRLRAGQTVRHSGSVVILGDVNAGSEIIAGGDIVVWGRLRGTAHAGCLGNTSAVVCALDLSPLQLRIADIVTRPDEGAVTVTETYPEVAYVRDHTIIVERWSGIRWRD